MTDATELHMKCINDMTDGLLEIADVLGEHQVNVKLDDGRYLNPVSAIRSKVDIIWDEALAIRATAATLGGGKLTAEHVREAVYAHSIHADCADADWQAIADELNSTLGGECEFRPLKDEDWSEPNAVRGMCSECSALMFGKDNYCPNCGRRTVKR